MRKLTMLIGIGCAAVMLLSSAAVMSAGEIRDDRKEIKQDRKELKGDRIERKADRRELVKDRRELRRDLKDKLSN